MIFSSDISSVSKIFLKPALYSSFNFSESIVLIDAATPAAKFLASLSCQPTPKNPKIESQKLSQLLEVATMLAKPSANLLILLLTSPTAFALALKDSTLNILSKLFSDMAFIVLFTNSILLMLVSIPLLNSCTAFAFFENIASKPASTAIAAVIPIPHIPKALVTLPSTVVAILKAPFKRVTPLVSAFVGAILSWI